MKRTFFIMLLALCPLLLFPQQFQGGLAAGLVGSQVGGDRYSGYNKIGFMGGGYVSLQLAPRYSLQMEMEYIQKGSRNLDDPDNPDDQDYKLQVSYIEVPFLLRYQINTHLSAEAGLAVAFLAGYKEEGNGLNLKGLLPGFKSTNLSFVAGIGYTWHERYRFVFRSDNSLLPIRKDSFPGNVKRFFSDWGQFHDLLVFSLFYRL